MTESIKFGPEWLRNSVANVPSSINDPSSATTAHCRPQLSENRYGREEMLSLCEKTPRLPDYLPKRLFVEQSQCPLALLPQTDEDIRTIWPHIRQPLTTMGSGMVVGRGGGRGGSIDRGRGRGRGVYHSTSGYQRSSSMYDEDLRSGGNGGGRVQTNFQGERLWLDRNGTDTPSTDWNSSSAISPRKEYGGGGGGSGGGSGLGRPQNMENWRKSSRTQDDNTADVDWRNPGSGGGSQVPTSRDKWARSTSWRDGEDSAGGGDANLNRSMSSNNNNGGGPPSLNANSDRQMPPKLMNKKSWDDDHLPEWATEYPFDYGGSFDASGAFHDSEEDGFPSKSHRHHREKGQMKQEKMSMNRENREKPKMDNVDEGDRNGDMSMSKSPPSTDVQQTDHRHMPKMMPLMQQPPPPSQQQQQQLHQLPPITNNREQLLQQQQQQQMSQPPPNYYEENAKESGPQKPAFMDYIGDDKQLPIPGGRIIENIDRMQEVDYMVASLIMDDEVSKDKPPGITAPPAVTTGGPPPPSIDWFYRDPQGENQGPFTATEMSEWYKAGYFQDTLLVRRHCDRAFSTLGELVKAYGAQVPFMASSLMPPQIPPSVVESPNIQPRDMQIQMQLQKQQQFLMRHELQAQQLAQEIDGYNVMTPEQQIFIINRLQQQQLQQHQQQLGMRPQEMAFNKNVPVPDGAVVATGNRHVIQDIQGRRMIDFYPPGGVLPQQVPNQVQQNPVPSVPTVTDPNDPIQSLILQLHMQKSGVAGDLMQQPPPAWMKPMQSHQQPNHIQQQNYQNPPPQQQQLLQQQQQQHQQQQQQQQQQTIKNMEQVPLQQQQIGTQAPAGGSSSAAHWSGTPMSIWELGVKQEPQQMQHHNQQQQHQQQLHHLQQQQQLGGTQQQKMDSHQALEEKLLAMSANNKKEVQENGQKQDIADQYKNNKQQREERKKKLAEMAAVDNEGFEKAGSKKKLDLQKRKENTDKTRPETDAEKRKREKDRKQTDDDEKQQKMRVKALHEYQQQLEQLKKKNNVGGGGGSGSDEKLQKQQQEERMTTLSVAAPWSGGYQQQQASGPSLAKIQKNEAQRRAESMRTEQSQRELHRDMQQREQKDAALMWNQQVFTQQKVKTLDEIQAEEHAKATAAAVERDREQQAQQVASKRDKKIEQHDAAMLASIWNQSAHNLAWQQPKVWSNGQSGLPPPPPPPISGGQSSTSSGGFWEEPTKFSPKPAPGAIAAGGKVLLAKSQTMNSITTTTGPAVANAVAKKQQQQQLQQQQQQQLNNNKRSTPSGPKVQQQRASQGNINNNHSNHISSRNDDNNSEFATWCTRALGAMNGNVDIPTFVGFLQDIESPFEVKDYIKMYLGETKECTEFAKLFLERRSKHMQQKRALNAHIDDMCSPAPAITPSTGSSSDFQEVKGKNKKVKARKVLDGQLLGFSVTSATDRINVGDRDYADA